MTRKVAHIKSLYPDVSYVGVADGAAENWGFLKSHVATQVLDFYHASEYVAKAAEAAFPRSKFKRRTLMEQWCHDLKHKKGAAHRLLKEMEEIAHTAAPRTKVVTEKLTTAITYFTNHKH